MLHGDVCMSQEEEGNNPNIKMVWSQILDMSETLSSLRRDIKWLKDEYDKLDSRIWYLATGIVVSSILIFVSSYLLTFL
ncbi:MAG: hypothetical protein DRN29_08280, partial [Thermoplasmata archaeon]